MASKSYKLVKLESEPEDEPKHFYTARRPTKGEKVGIKLRLRKYNPYARKHMWYKETKLK
jgi:ribosomal protein L33